MKVIKVSLKDNSYQIIVGSGVLDKLGTYLKRLRIGVDAYIITNSYLKAKFGERLNKSLANSGFSFYYRLVPDTERSKSFFQVKRILSDLAAYDQQKNIFIIAFGGGVVGDLAGFVASIYRRGRNYIQVPTSFLAQVDSSIGGKTAVDLAQGKNLVGTFYQPKFVLSDIGLLKTLDQRQLRTALAEIIKYAVIKDRELFIYLENNLTSVLTKNKACLEFIVTRCAKIKARIVSQDEKEKKGLRTILNFGHTLGHALETAGNFKVYNHGEAVGLGMLLACGISRKLNLLKESDFAKIESLIKKSGLPVVIKGLNLDKIIDSYYYDKKFIGARNRFVLLSGIGQVKIRENISLEIIKEVLRGRLPAA